MGWAGPTPDWDSSDWGIKVRGQDHLMRAISRIGTLDSTRIFAWRGDSDASHRLQSSLFRKLAQSGVRPNEAKMQLAENGLLEEARTWGIGAELGYIATDLYILGHLQHHGLPTRLLDVTSNPMTALWFACMNPETDGVLFAIDVTGTSWLRTSGPGFDDSGPAPDGVSMLHSVINESARTRLPIRIFPSLPGERMKAQEGYFLAGHCCEDSPIPGVDDIPLVRTAAPGAQKLSKLFRSDDRGRGRPARVAFCALVIPKATKRLVIRHLEGTYNRRRRVLFPDVDGFKEAYGHGELTLPQLD